MSLMPTLSPPNFKKAFVLGNNGGTDTTLVAEDTTVYYSGGTNISNSGSGGTNVRGFYDSGWHWFIDSGGNIQKTQDFISFTNIPITSISNNNSQNTFFSSTGSSIHKYPSGEIVVVGQKYNATSSQDNDYITLSYSSDGGANFTLNSLKNQSTFCTPADAIYDSSSYLIPYSGSSSLKGYLISTISGTVSNDVSLTRVPNGTGCFIASFDGNANGRYFPAETGVYRVLRASPGTASFSYNAGAGYNIIAIRHCPILDMIMMVGWDTATEKFYAISKVNGVSEVVCTVPSISVYPALRGMNLEALTEGGFICSMLNSAGTSTYVARTLDGVTWEQLSVPTNTINGTSTIFLEP
jgi:hypothetical protein